MDSESWEEEDTGDKEMIQEISESAEYSPKSDFSKAQIVFNQMEKCCILRSEEMRAGYSTHVIDKMGNVKLIHIADARKKYMGAVEALMNMLSPEIKRLRDEKIDKRKKMTKPPEEYIKNFKNAVDEIKKKYIYKERAMRLINGKPEIIYTGREYIPEVGEILFSGLKPIAKGIMGENKVEGLWDGKVNAYYNELLELYDILFADLNCLIDELNYFKQKQSF